MQNIFSNLHQFHFIRPWWWLAIIPLFFLISFYKKQSQKNHAWEQVCDSHLLPYLLKNQFSSQSNRWLWILYLLSFILVFALAGPTWRYTLTPIYQKKINRVVVMDLSNNTIATDLPPSRLVRERYKLRDLLQKVREGEIGLVVYAGEAYTVSPLTSDAKTIASMVEQLTPNIMPIQGNNLSSGLKLASKLFKGANQSQGNIIVLSAGMIDSSSITLAKQLATKGFTTSVLGIGASKKVPLKDPQGHFMHNNKGEILFSQYHANTLASLADAGDGIYLPFSNDNADITQLLQQNKVQNFSQSSKAKLATKQWKDEGFWFVLLALPLVLLSFRRKIIKQITG